jgi:hypothetical protein
MWPNVVAFASNIWGHLITLVAGCVVTYVIGLIEKHVLKRPVSLRTEVGILAVFVFAACFQAWQDQHTSAKGRADDLHTAELKIVKKDAEIVALNRRVTTLQDALAIAGRPISPATSPELAKVRQVLSKLLGKSSAVIDLCRGGPSDQCMSERRKWENEVTKILSAYKADPSGAPRWTSYIAQQQNGPPFLEVSNESLLLAAIINQLR